MASAQQREDAALVAAASYTEEKIMTRRYLRFSAAVGRYGPQCPHIELLTTQQSRMPLYSTLCSPVFGFGSRLLSFVDGVVWDLHSDNRVQWEWWRPDRTKP